MVGVRRWIEYVGLLKDDATLNTEHIREEIADAERDLNAKSSQQQEALQRSRLNRAKSRLAEARRHRRQIRKRLHLED
jgi:hypothetical protein